MKILYSILFVFIIAGRINAQTTFQTSLEKDSKIFSLFETLDSTEKKKSVISNLEGYEFLYFSKVEQIEDVPISKLNISPLVDASVGFDSQKKQTVSSTGIGLMLDGYVGRKLFLNAKIFQGSGSFAGYIDSVIGKTNIMPFAGYAHPLANNKFYFWNNSFSLRYTPNKFFSFVFANDRNFFGNGYRSLLLSNNAYSYPHLKVVANLWKVKYQAIFTNFYDVRLSNGNFNNFKNKYGAIHYLQWQVVKKLQLSFFEAIMFQSRKQSGFGYDINYMNPLIFYRPVEYSLGSTDNSLLGGNLVWNPKKNLTIYSQIILDEFLLSAVKARKGWVDNKQGIQVGAKTSQHIGKQYFNFLAEFNYLRPFIYSHRNGNQNYANYGMPLAHPFGGNFYEVLGMIKYRPTTNFQLNITGSYAFIGYDLNGISYGQNINNSYINRVHRNTLDEGNYVGQGLTTKQLLLQCKAYYGINKSTNTCINAGFMIRGISNVNVTSINFYPFIGISSFVFKEAGIY